MSTDNSVLTKTNAEELNACWEQAKQAEEWLKLAKEYKKVKEETYEKYYTAYELWQIKRDKYIKQLDDWKKFQGDYAKYRGYDNRNVQFANCNDGEWSPKIAGMTYEPKKPQTDCLSIGQNYVYTGTYEECYSTAGFLGDFKNGKVKVQCQLSDDYINNITKEYKALMPILEDEPKIGEGEFSYPESDPINVVISCCNNVMNFTGNVDATDNVQTCQQQITQELQKIEQKKKEEQKTGEETKLAIKQESTVTKQEEPVDTKKEEATQETKSNTMYYVGGAVGSLSSVCCSVLCLIIIIIVVVMMSSSSGEEYFEWTLMIILNYHKIIYVCFGIN